MSSPPASTHPESDPERTAELPVLDPTAYAAAGDPHQSGTDTWIVPALAACPADAPPPAANPEPGPAAGTEKAPSPKLRETQELLASQDARLTQVERARTEAYAAPAAGEQGGAQLACQLG